MEEYKASSSSTVEPIMNKKLNMILKSQMLRDWVLGGWLLPFTKSNRSWVWVWESQKVGALCIE